MIKRTLGFVEHRTECAIHTWDEIKVKFLPARDGSPPGFLKTVIMPDGRVIQISAADPNE